MGDREVPLARYALLSIAAALVTMALKLPAWWLTGSVGLLSDALESRPEFAAIREVPEIARLRRTISASI